MSSNSDPIVACMHHNVLAARQAGANPNYGDIAKHCFESASGLPASGPSSAGPSASHRMPGACPPGFYWCHRLQSCVPLGGSCCPPQQKWCPERRACIPSQSRCTGGCPEGQIWCPALGACINPWERHCPSAHVPAVPAAPGGSVDSHGCRSSAGERWCEPMQQCVYWSTPCNDDGPSGEGTAYVRAAPGAMENEMQMIMPAYQGAPKAFGKTGPMGTFYDMPGAHEGGSSIGDIQNSDPLASYRNFF